MSSFDKILIKLDKIARWLLLVLVVLYIISGYGMTHQIIDPVFARYLHITILPIPFYVCLAIHLSRFFRTLFQRLKNFLRKND